VYPRRQLWFVKTAVALEAGTGNHRVVYNGSSPGDNANAQFRFEESVPYQISPIVAWVGPGFGGGGKRGRDPAGEAHQPQ
jgi:hypothetical protein